MSADTDWITRLPTAEEVQAHEDEDGVPGLWMNCGAWEAASPGFIRFEVRRDGTVVEAEPDGEGEWRGMRDWRPFPGMRYRPCLPDGTPTALTKKATRPARAVRVIDPAHAEDLRRAMADLIDGWRDREFSASFIADVSRVLAWWGSLPVEGRALTGEVERLTARVAELEAAHWTATEHARFRGLALIGVARALGLTLADESGEAQADAILAKVKAVRDEASALRRDLAGVTAELERLRGGG